MARWSPDITELKAQARLASMSQVEQEAALHEMREEPEPPPSVTAPEVGESATGVYVGNDWLPLAEVLTPALLQRAYGVLARVERCSEGNLLVLADAALPL